jgi:dTDP-4-dehydrorhamnose 3,5-epimerase
VESLKIEGAWSYTPRQFPDDRGTFLEAFRGQELADALGYRLDVEQVNCSVSRRGVIRGIHYADVPPGQAKYVSCVRGAILDVVVDIRVGSPTFGAWEAVRLDEANRGSLFIAEGLGHGFVALTDDATVLYLCSTGFAPGREHGINPMDPAIGIEWPLGELGGAPVLSAKDAQAPSLREALDAGQLPRYEDCLGYADVLRRKD